MLVAEEAREPIIGSRVQVAYATINGEHQLAEYAARDRGVRKILVAAPEGLPLLAARRPECRVGRGERRSFGEVIRIWSECVLSGVEGGKLTKLSGTTALRRNR